MRIIGGTYGGRVIRLPKGLPVRPTTDRMREALFNTLAHRLDWEGLQALDLYCGSGMVSYELRSRGAARVLSVDQDRRCVAAVREGLRQLGLAGEVLQMEAGAFLAACRERFGLIFMDPPYAMPGIEEQAALILERGLLEPEGWLVVEHSARRRFDRIPGFAEERCYGDSAFSFLHLP
jgi:16S rRNA (guanine(966)-N(2))-methyltransferase RsmD